MPTSALLVMDVQRGIVERFAAGADDLLTTLATATAAARAHAVAVVFVQVAFRPGAPEVSARNKAFSAVTSSGTLTTGDPGTLIHPAVAPQPEDVVVTKRRVSAFAGSDLDVVLRSLEVRTLVLTGIATSGVVLSTLRQAADLDYELTVLRDGCLDPDPEVHRVLLEKVFVRQATVVDTETWIDGLARSAIS